MKKFADAAKVIISTVMALVLIAFVPAEAQAQEYPYRDCIAKYSGINGSEMTAGFVYSDEMLLVDSGSLSTDLAKASAALAAAAYDHGRVVDVLENEMGFSVTGGWDSYFDTQDMPVDDCDRVAYIIAGKEIGDYIAYCVPVRGTPQSAEWFSDFDLGTSGDHKGFHAAALEVQAELYPILLADGYSAEKTIIWIMGHSRGAAVSNIIAGDLTRNKDYAKNSQIFSYNFACPAVSKDVKGFNNIYNFNGAGDVVCALPLESWGYGRYGRTISMNRTEDGNFLYRFAEKTGSSFSAASSTAGYLAVFNMLVPAEEDYYDPLIQLAVKLAAWGLGGKEDVSWADAIGSIEVDLGTYLWDTVINSSGIGQLLYGIKTANSSIATSIAFVNQHADSVSAMTDEEFEQFRQNYSWDMQTVEMIVGGVIPTKDAFAVARSTLARLHGKGENMSDTVSGLLGMFFNSDGGILDAVNEAHAMTGYVLAINSWYYGYEGYMNNGAVGGFVLPDNINTVGAYCFYGCENMETVKLQDGLSAIGEAAFAGCAKIRTLEIPRSVRYLNNGAFNRCYGLTHVTLPVELSRASVFMEAVNVESIYYTAGSTGIMPDRENSYASDNNYYAYTLEYQSGHALKSIEFEEGVRHIADYAYYNSYSDSVLESVTLPSTLESIGRYAFYDLKALKAEIVLPEGFNAIGECAFSGSAITGVTLPATLTVIPEGTFYDCDGISILDIPVETQSLGANAFGSCDGITSVIMPVELSATGPFWNCYNVETIRYTVGSDGVMPDRGYAYGEANEYGGTLESFSSGKLRDVRFEEGVTHIADYAFYNSYGTGVLESVSIPSTLKSIGKCAFVGLPHLRTDLVLPEGFNSIGEQCFQNCPLQKVVLPSTLTEIAPYCFYGCTEMKTDLPANLVSVGEGAFRECRSIETLNIPRSTQYIGIGAFQECSGIKEVTLPVELSVADVFYGVCNVEKISYTVGSTGIMPDRQNLNDVAQYYGNTLEFGSRAALKSVVFEEGVRHIADYAFFYDWAPGVLESVTLPSTLETIGKYAFYDLPKLNVAIVLPEGVSQLGEYAFAKTGIVSFILPGGLTAVPTGCFYDCDNLTKADIHPGITSIGDNAFGSCDGLVFVSIPVELSAAGPFYNTYNVETIRYTVGSDGVMPDRGYTYGEANEYGGTLESFSSGKLRNVCFEEGVTHIADYAFYNNYNTGVLESVSIPSTLKSIGKCAFEGQLRLCTDIILPEGFNSIGEQCFRNCPLQKVTLPSTLTEIAPYCFYGCTEMKTDLPANLVSVGEGAFRECRSIETLNIPRSTQYLGLGAFQECSGIKEVTLPVELSVADIFYGVCNVEKISYTVGSTGIMPDRQNLNSVAQYYGNTLEFGSRAALKRVVFEEGVRHIADYAFFYDWAPGVLESVTLPSTLETIGRYAFYDLPKLNVAIVLPEGLTVLGDGCFYGLSGLGRIEFLGAAPEFGSDVFRGVEAEAYYNPARGGWDDAVLHDYGGSITWIAVGPNVTINYESVDLILSGHDIGSAVRLVVLQAGEDITDSVLWDVSDTSVVSVENGWMTGIGPGTAVVTGKVDEETEVECSVTVHDNVPFMSLPDQLKTLDDEAFRGMTGIKAMILNEGLISVGAGAFADCTNLIVISIPDSVADIAEDAFSGCENMRISGVAGSYAETFALSSGIPFVPAVPAPDSSLLAVPCTNSCLPAVPGANSCRD